MPNHCESDLYIHGKKEQVDALLALIGADKEQPEFNFSAVIPYPQEYAVRDADMKSLGWKGFSDKYGEKAKDGYNSGGYEWCILNWGTKWDAYEVARRDYGGVCISFQTPWGPPEPVICALHRIFPECTLTLEYFERGMAFCGGFSLLAEDEWHEDSPWQAGQKYGEWRGEYRGHRGG